MKPSKVHYLLAHSFALSSGLGALIATGFLLKLYFDAEIFQTTGFSFYFYMLSIIPVAALGAVLGIFPCWQIVGRIVRRLQGAPFHVGDSVCVLTGRHKNTTAYIYEVWEERGQVRIDLGSDLKEKVEDVFGFMAICKIQRVEQSRPANLATLGG